MFVASLCAGGNAFDGNFKALSCHKLGPCLVRQLWSKRLLKSGRVEFDPNFALNLLQSSSYTLAEVTDHAKETIACTIHITYVARSG